MKDVRAKLGRFVNPLIALAMGIGYVALLLATCRVIGYARDEGFYFSAAGSYERWFALLFENPSRAFEKSSVDTYWSANHEHPALMKSLFALSHRYFFEKWHWFADGGTAYRFPGMVVSTLGILVTFLWGARSIGRFAGFVAAALLALMPRVFYHAHLDCFDVPVASMWLITTYAYARSLDGRPWLWPLATGILYGLLLNTKHNAWLFPGMLVAHLVIWRGSRLWRELRTGTLQIPLALLAVFFVGPVVFYATWPWIWFDTGKRLAEWFAFHLAHDYYNMEFLGRTYWKPPMPRLYAWVMTAATVPGITLVLFAIGLVSRAKSLVRPLVPQRWAAKLFASEQPAASRAADLERAIEMLWLLGILVSYAPWLSSNTPIFGGTKHWLTAYPFLCLFAGRGVELARQRIGELVSENLRRRHAHDALLAVGVLTGPLLMTLHSNPWGLSFYTPLVGGAPGAATIGLNRSFWGYTTGAIAPDINRRAPPNATVYVHDTALQSWDQMQRDGRLRSDLRGSLDIASSSVAIYHHEQHMARVEQQVWIDYGTDAPAALGVYQGVPIVWMYVRPPAPQ